MLNQNFVIVAIVIDIIGTISYVIDTARGKIKPNRVTFFMWSIAPLIAFAAQITQRVGIQSLMTLAVGVLPLTVFIASFLNKKAYWKLTTFDLACGGLSLLGLFFWYLTKIGNIALFFSILAEGLATLPTMVKSYRYPETESGWPWLASFTAGFLTVSTIRNWDFAHYSFLLFYSVEMLIIYLFVKFRIGNLLKTKA